MKVIDGNKLAEKILDQVQKDVYELDISPQLDIIFVGNSPASEVYVNKKIAAGQKVGISVNVHKYETITQQELLELVIKLNFDNNCNAIIIQLPVPGIDTYSAMESISPLKDVDGLNPLSLGRLWHGKRKKLIPATALAIEYIIGSISEESGKTLKEFLTGKHVVIVNRSLIIGKPITAMLLENNATVTIAHSKTENLSSITKNADIIVSGTGKSGLITAEMIKEGVVLIDTGFGKSNSEIWGDIDKKSVQDKASWLSPVPNGVGPVGVSMLIKNTLTAAKLQKGLL